ncbi:hypothetical protein FRC14_007456 [Serendipita sp. 396]|nr:hypothetical protein FRC14_007456 [Serendipita sp. 396]KAG8786561.1 hypothetical protein FRC15_011207 [Serendipita sp. 397]KAG8827515.1 hypothetical protein FRC19_002593 [Serendipita sp. 401]KAG8871225.1 hypothetical protein FRC20_010840 [Serendipita sp. 405]KAG9057922.1 hypothetical protein FS842_002924 [Serendipita sp. 407]
MNSPAEVQKAVFRRQLKQAVSLGKPITIHTREAEEDTEAILMEEVPKDHKVHVHCFTDSPEFAQRLLSHFPNLCIGITGVITYSTNLNTSEVIRRMMATGGGTALTDGSPLRILLETDAPYMVPSNIYESLALTSGGKNPRLAFSHSGMIAWTAGFVADIANGASSSSTSLASSARVVEGTHQNEDGDSETTQGTVLDANDVLEVSRRNARLVYGV